MKRMRLLSLAVAPLLIAQCGPDACVPVPIPDPPPAESTCDPNYTGCVPIDADDVDCAGGEGNGPSYFDGTAQVIGEDIYGLDSDGDGVAC